MVTFGTKWDSLFLFHQVPWYQSYLMFIKLPFQYQLLQKLNFCSYGYCLEKHLLHVFQYHSRHKD